MAMMYYSVKDIHTDLYSERGYPIPSLRSRTEALLITDTELHSEIGYSSAPIIKESNLSPKITCSEVLPQSDHMIT